MKVLAMRPRLALIALLAVTATPALAQERTAGQNYDAQVNWSALSNQLNILKSQNQALAGIIDKMNACSSLQKIYAPTAPDADAKGCIDAGNTPGTLCGEKSSGVNIPCKGITLEPLTVKNKNTTTITGVKNCPAGYTGKVKQVLAGSYYTPPYNGSGVGKSDATPGGTTTTYTQILNCWKN